LNLYAGATSAWSTLFSAACVFLCLLFLTDFIYYLPRSVLAAMIIVPVLNLFDPRAFRKFFNISRDDGTIAVVTFLITLLAMPRLHWGVFAGIALTMVFYLYRRTHPRIIEVSVHPDGTLRDTGRFDLPPLAADVLAVRMDEALNFLTGTTLERFVIARCNTQTGIRRVLLCSSPLNDIDASGVSSLEVLHSTLQSLGIELYMSAIKKQVWDVLEKAGMIDEIGEDHIFSTDSEAILSMQSSVEKPT
jgi:sulfate permease, SulP family